ncbi:hypothetical protein LEL_10798 [Akanthomyces lecanii RCEF 1005]|uniref:Uncharacterized protein n=1 Tax=Akanthomyces lecanii RCEF 1005 TaxID=1081108 RepID=A0A167THZ1_CORDF|nr:hypothetical protein LEL_10798 [Akanthomyces lecanii RCEF 1005]
MGTAIMMKLDNIMQMPIIHITKTEATTTTAMIDTKTLGYGSEDSYGNGGDEAHRSPSSQKHLEANGSYASPTVNDGLKYGAGPPSERSREP